MKSINDNTGLARNAPETAPIGPGAPAAIQTTAQANVPMTLPADSPALGVTDLPEQFGRYRILKKLGQGGMGAVYLAHDSQLDRRVALKVPRFPLDDSGAAERFRREAQAAAALHHPNLCPVYDVGQIDGKHFLTMAYVEGQSLAEAIGAGPRWPVRDCALLVRQLASALEVAHHNGIIHRDLKPANVLLNVAGEPVITDFGLARRLTQTGERLTASGAILGTPAYMSPEQVEGRTDEIGQAADIYSLGVILYELLTGTIPFRGSMASVLAQIVSAELEPPSRLRSDLDSQLEEIVMKAMSKNANDRYGSMSQFATALSGYLECDRPTATPSNRVATFLTTETARGVPAAAAATLSPSPTNTTARPRRRLVLVALGLLAAVVLSGIIYIRIKDKDGTEQVIEVSSGSTITITDKYDKDGKKPAEVDPEVKPPAGADKPLGTGKHNKGVILEVMAIERADEGMVPLMKISWRYRNATNKDVQVFTPWPPGTYPREGIARDTINALYYTCGTKDTAGRIRIAKDKGGKVWASSLPEGVKVKAGETSMKIWAKFDLPPADAKTINLVFNDLEDEVKLTLPSLAK